MYLFHTIHPVSSILYRAFIFMSQICICKQLLLFRAQFMLAIFVTSKGFSCQDLCYSFNSRQGHLAHSISIASTFQYIFLQILLQPDFSMKAIFPIKYIHTIFRRKKLLEAILLYLFCCHLLKSNVNMLVSNLQFCDVKKLLIVSLQGDRIWEQFLEIHATVHSSSFSNNFDNF